MPATTEPLTGNPWLRRISSWDDVEADEQIRHGLPMDLVVQLQKLLELTDEEAAHVIGRSRSTYVRYRNANKELGVPEAERAVRYARLLTRAASIFGSLVEARDWMRESNYALGGVQPIELAETEPGATLVREALMGVEHGFAL